MTDKSPQSVEASPEPSIDLEQELNALLGQIESANAAEAPATDPPNGGAPAGAGDEEDELDRQIDRVIAGDGSAETEPPVTDSADAGADTAVDPEVDESLDGDFDTAEDAISQSDDPLADQIQELLDEAKAQSPPEAPADDAPAQDASPEGSDGPAINELDQMLAEGADGAVAGEFESFDEVMGTDASNTADKPAPAAPPADDAAAGPASPDADLAIDDEDAFASPEQVLEEEDQAAAASAGEPGASAADVARELDDQPEPVAAAKASAAPAPENAEHAEAAKPKRDWHELARVNTERLRRGCARVNRPLGQFPPEVRNTIGYVGLATLANAVVLILYGLFA